MQPTQDCCWRHSLIRFPARTAAIANVAFWHTWKALEFRLTTRDQKTGPGRREYLHHAARLAAFAVVFGGPKDRVAFMPCPCGECNSVGLVCDIDPQQLINAAGDAHHMDITDDVNAACGFFEDVLAAYQASITQHQPDVTQDSGADEA